MVYRASIIVPTSSAKSFWPSCDALLKVSERSERYVSWKTQSNGRGIFPRGPLGRFLSKKRSTCVNWRSNIPIDASSAALVGGVGIRPRVSMT
jgi:hypothetical protein